MPNDNNIPTPSVTPPAGAQPATDVIAEVANKISEAHNILVALSSDPSVDEMSAAIGLSLFLDKMGKRATAIYSGTTPNALEFLKPEETFEPSVDTLQDFVIALNKEKADHLRYKLDGDFVKIFITPYRTRIGEEDLDFSYGDFNVDLVLALDVANGVDLDSALREHGRIMHDASIVNITTGNPGKLGEIEWSDKSASSVSEMIAKLLYSQTGKFKIEKEEATAFLTGIVAATNRFSNAKTTPDSMKLASRLMESGANQQLISKNITPDVDNELFSLTSSQPQAREADPTKLDIEHAGEEGVDESKEVDTVVTEKESTLLDDLKAAEASLSQAGAETTPEPASAPVNLDQPGAIDSASEPVATTAPSAPGTPVSPELPPVPEVPPMPEISLEPPVAPTSDSSPELPPVSEPAQPSTSELAPEPPVEPTTEPEPASEPAVSSFVSDKSEKVLQPSDDLSSGFLGDEGTSKYGQMLEDALSGVTDTPTPAPITSPMENPATMSAPAVPTAPEINGVPEINYMPMPGEEVLPPPPTPPIDMNATVPENPAPVVPAPVTTPIAPATPAVEPTPAPLGNQPAMQDQVYTPQASDPGAFKIPGM